MSQEDINDDLGHYIKEKHKREPFWKKFKHKHETREDVQEDIKHELEAEEKIENISPEDKKDLEEMESKIEEVNEVEDKVEEEIDDEREGILQRFFKKLNFGKKNGETDDGDISYLNEKSDDSEEEKVTVDDEEMKEFLKSMHSWITKLDPETQKEFKNSPDFEKYTEMLKKHGLIK
jgi:hypothetical protein